MINFISALEKRSSISCIAKEEYGIVSIEFATFSDARDMRAMIETALHNTINPTVPSYINVKNRVRFQNNFWVLFQIISDYAIPTISRVILPTLYYQGVFIEGEEEIVRFALIWEFTSANRTEDMFSRLRWMLEKS